MAPIRKPRIKVLTKWRLFLPITVTVFVAATLYFLLLLRYRSPSFVKTSFDVEIGLRRVKSAHNNISMRANLPLQNAISLSLQKRNQLPPKNKHLYPILGKHHTVVVLYVHNRPEYLKIVISSLSKVVGINETLLIVSHDGEFPEMDAVIRGVEFCRVKQIHALFSPHIFVDRFPGSAPSDCGVIDHHAGKVEGCEGDPDQYGNYREPKVVSLKHHWWWMMNTVWDGLEETRRHSGHMLFIEEDHFIFPNAYRNIQALASLMPVKCSDCYAANLAPSDVRSMGEGWESLIAERMGNIGYSFNRTVWKMIHDRSAEFCRFDDYNWDITMWSTVFPSFGRPVYTLRGPRTSAVHFGECGLHQGRGSERECVVNGSVGISPEEGDMVENINEEWGVHTYENQAGYQAGFKGWGGWGDSRDHLLCLGFSSMYHV